MRFSLQSPNGENLFVAAYYQGESESIYFTNKREDACSFATITKAIQVALKVEEYTGSKPAIFSTCF
tara:strand:+ start:5035 stop:5235 length:201 start_codon:yes stop_codon:yes gene_type:complete